MSAIEKKNTECYDTRIKVHRTSGSILIAESALNDRQAVGFPSPFEVLSSGAKVPEAPRVSWRRSIYAQCSHARRACDILARACRSGGQREWKKRRWGEQTRKLLIASFVRRIKDKSSHSSRPLNGSDVKKGRR